MSDAWIDQLARRLSVPEPDRDEINRVLAAARDVAHGVERRVTPVSTYLLGMAVQRSLETGTERGRAFGEALAALEDTIPETEPNDVP